METDPQDIDLGGEEPSADPLADVQPETEFDQPDPDPLPPGVEQGELGGYNPSDETPEPDPLAEPEPGEFLEDPEEQEVGVPEEPGEPAGEAIEAGPQHPHPDSVEHPDDPPEPEPMPEAVPEAEQVEPEPEPGLPPTPEADAAMPIEPVKGEAAEPEPEPQSETPVGDSSQGETAPEPAPEPEPEEPKKPKRSRRKRATLKEGEREYVPFRQVASNLNLTAEDLIALAEDGKLWIEEKPIVSRSGEYALRRTFRNLSEDGDESSFVLAAVPAKLWSPKEVKAQRRAQTSISIG